MYDLKLGDLVRMVSMFEGKMGYKSPGIIINQIYELSSYKYIVMWSNGKITDEHSRFLVKI